MMPMFFTQRPVLAFLLISFVFLHVPGIVQAKCFDTEQVPRSEEQVNSLTEKKQVQFNLPETAAAYDLAKRFFANAVKAGDMEVCRNILEQGAYYINDVDSEGFTQLYYAACSGQSELCRLMLERGANPIYINPGKSDSLTPFEAAIVNNHTESAKVLLEYLGETNLSAVRGRNQLALFLAIQNRNREIVRALIDKGADVNTPGKFTKIIHTPLFFAACLNDVEMCEMLVEAGAELTGCYTPEVNVSDVLFVAALSQSKELCEFLFEHDFDPNTLNSQRRNTLQELLRNRTPLVYHKTVNPFEIKRTPFTVMGPYAFVIRPVVMKDDQADVTPLPGFGNNSGVGQYNIIDGDNEPQTVPNQNGNGKTKKSDFIEFIRLFIDHGTNVNHRDKAGCSVLDTLFLTQMKSNHSLDDFEKLIDLLIDAGVDLNAQDKNGWSSLNYMLFYLFMCKEPSRNDDADDSEANDDQQNDPFTDTPEETDDDADDAFSEEEDETDAEIAAVTEPAQETKEEKSDSKRKFDERRIALFKKLIDAGADAKQADKKGNTLLHYAASATGETIRKGGIGLRLQYETGGDNRDFCRKLMELLVDHGVSISTENKDGETPYDWARQGGPLKSQQGTRMGLSGYGGGGYGGGRGGGMTPMPSTKADAVNMLMQGK